MPTESERRLEELFTSYVDRLNGGEELDAENILAENPVLGVEILDYLEEYIATVSSDNGGNQAVRTLGDYTLRRQIGRGGMGVVYEAWENSMDRAVALKVLPSGAAVDDRTFHRFMREARTAGKLSHPNVVPVYGVGLKEHTPYYAMEYVEGETLAEILTGLNDVERETETPFGKKDDVGYFGNLARAFVDVADGLQHAHSRGVIHRDIKPSNLILDGKGNLRILDFGLARLEGQESLTMSGDLMGTVLYMSPEQAMAKRIPLDHRTDVYSLGATMYEVFTGEPPFRGKDQHDTLSQIIVRDPRPPRQLNSSLPRDLETIVLKCLRKDAGDRYGTAEALAQDLRRFVRGDPVEARPESRWQRLARRARPYSGRILVGTVAFVLVALAAGGFHLDAERKRQERVARTEEAVTRHLAEAETLWRQANPDTRGLAKLRDALAAADTAAALAAEAEDVASPLRQRSTTLRERLQREVDNRDMLARLEELPAPTEYFEKREAKHHAGFEETFREYGIDVDRLDPTLAAEKIRESGIATELALALEIWAKLLARPAQAERSERLMEIVMLADPDPWRNRLRQAVVSGDVGEAKRLAADVDVGRISDRRIGFLAAHLFNRGESDAAESLLRRAQRHLAHERSYWTNYWLGFICSQKGLLEESERYLRAAVLCGRGERSGRVRAHLGHVLIRRGRLDEAAAAYLRAFQLSPGEEASYGGISQLLSQLNAEGKSDALARLVRALNEVVASGEGHPEASRVLVEAWVLAPAALNAAEVLAAASNEVDRARREDEDPSVQRALVLLARARFAAGERRDAVRILETADRLVGRDEASIRSLLEKYRAALWPDLVSYASIDAAVERGEVLVPEGAEWRFFRGPREPSPPGLEWTGRDFDDSSWESGASGFGYGDGDDATVLEDMPGSYTTLYVRHRFTLPDPSLFTRFWLSVTVDDGCVAYVNGHEIGRVRLDAGGEAGTAVASFVAREPLYPVPLPIPRGFLEQGENVLALEGLNHGIDSSDFTLIPILCAERRPDLASERTSFESLRRIAARDTGDGAARLAYLEGRLHARAGDPEKAMGHFRRVLDLDPGRPEPYLRLAESLRAAGAVDEAADVLRELLTRVEFPAVQDWNRWLAFNFVHRERSPAEILEVLRDEFPRDRFPRDGYTGDLRWLLERLAAGEGVYINCGGEEYRSVTGAIFGPDRFYVLGDVTGDKTRRDRIGNTDDDPLYASWRYFGGVFGARLGYEVPLPPGLYRLTLHLAIVYPPARQLYEGGKIRPSGLAYDVWLEGERVLEKFAPRRFATADPQSFTTRVDDGILNIEMVNRVHRGFVPTMQAFEIERAD